MKVTDVDTDLLGQLADAAAHVGEQAILHNEAEVRGSVPGLLDTLVPSEPYAYMLKAEVQGDGSVRLPFGTSRDDVRVMYEEVRGMSDVISEEPIIEIRTPWYAFWETLSTGQRKATGKRSQHPLAVLSPAGRGEGISGEIIWPLMPVAALGTGPAPGEATDDTWEVRRQLRLQHIRHVEALAAADVEGILEGFDEGGGWAIRNYVDETDSFVALHGRAEHRAHLEALFDRYEVRSIDLLHRVAQEWYLFAEIRVTVVDRSNGTTRAFHTAEIHAPGKDRRIVACLGWGTDVV